MALKPLPSLRPPIEERVPGLGRDVLWDPEDLRAEWSWSSRSLL